MLDDMRDLLGAPESAVEAAREQLAPRAVDPVFVVAGVNAAAVRLFLALGSQWRTVSLSTLGKATYIRTGLVYEAIETTARLRGVEVTPDDFARIQVMEAEAIEAWSEERRRAS